MPIAPGRPAAYWTRLPLRAILGEFTHDSIPATLSSDAGTFVCNSLFYNLLNWASAQDKVLAGFTTGKNKKNPAIFVAIARAYMTDPARKAKVEEYLAKAKEVGPKSPDIYFGGRSAGRR